MNKLDKSTLEVMSVHVGSYIYNEPGNVYTETEFQINWDSNLGFGTYTICVNNDGKITGRSEFMDSNENKSFLKALLEKVADSVEILE